MTQISELEWIKVKSTLPAKEFPPIASRPAVRTNRLIIRPFHQSDLEAVHDLRLQPEVMKWTMQGRPDKDLEETQKHLDIRLPSNEANNYDWAICLAETGQLIGIGGCMRLAGDLGWPVFGYILRKETWGQGYATEFVHRFLQMYWELPRREAEVEVDRHTVADPNGVVREQLIAVTADDNPASQKVLQKNGLTLVKKWKDPELLHAYTIARPASGPSEVVKAQ